MNEFESYGVFWDSRLGEDSAVTGRLRFHPTRGATLELVELGGLRATDFDSQDTREGLRFFGWLENKPVTLLDCWESNARVRSAGITERSYLVNRALRGAHLDETELQFDRGHLRTTGASDWIGRRIAPGADEAEGNIRIEWLNYSEPATEAARFDRGELRMRYAWSASGNGANDRVEFQHWPMFTIDYDDRSELSTIQTDFARIEGLVTLCANQVSSTEAFSLARKDIPVVTLSGERRKELQEIEYLAPTVYEGTWKRRRWHEMLLTYDEIGGATAVARWLEAVPQFARSLDSLLSAKRSRGILGENRLLNVVSAAESFHRDMYGGRSLPEQDFADLQARCLDVAGEYRDWLEQRLRFINERTLRERLHDLYDRVGEHSLPFVSTPNRWIAAVVNARNGLTHLTSRRRHHLAGADLYFLSESVYYLVRACMLAEVGVQPSDLADKSASYHFSWYSDRLTEAVETVRRYR